MSERDEDEDVTHRIELPRELGMMLQNALRRASRRRPGEDEAQEQSRPPVREQVAKLQDIFARYTHAEELQPGDIVQLKPGLGIIKDELREGLVFMFWKTLDLTNPLDAAFAQKWAERGVSPTIDCEVVHLCDDGHCLVSMGMDSATLEPRSIPADA